MTISSTNMSQTAVSPHTTILPPTQDGNIGDPTAKTPIDQLLERGLLIKVIHPQLHKRVARAWTLTQISNPFIEQHEGRYFISLASIDDISTQRQLYHLLHRFQIGAHIDVTQLPPQLRRIVQPQLTSREQLVGAFVLGLLPGLALGLLIMALSMLLAALLQISASRSFHFVAYTFAISFALGWLIATIILWYELKKNITAEL